MEKFYLGMDIGSNSVGMACTDENDELPETDGTYFCVDIDMSGLGSNSCGPLPLEKDRVKKRGNQEITLLFR